MKKSKEITKIIEGFKLGSLGASRVKFAKEPEEPGSVVVRGFIDHKTSLDWTEVASSGVIAKFKSISNLPLLSTIDARNSLFVVEQENGDLFLRLFITLRNPETNKSLLDGLFQLPLKGLKNIDKAREWLEKKKEYIKRDGLMAINFAGNHFWKEI